MEKEKFIPEETAETVSPLVEEAEKSAETLKAIFEKAELANKFETSLAFQFDRIFIKEVPAMPGSEDQVNQAEAQRKVLDIIKEIGSKERFSRTEQETMDKLAEYFTGLAQRSECIEHAKTAIGFLEHIPSKEAVASLEKLTQEPLTMINPENKNVRYYDPVAAQTREKLGPAAPQKEIVEKYIELVVQPEAMRAVIRLKEDMGIELSSEEEKYLKEHPEKF